MANPDENVFKRINFFKGFVTTEDDWNAAERYHVEKHKLHNRAFHGAGVVPGWASEFSIAARGKGELSVEVGPGYAIDAQGNDIILWKPAILPLNKGDFKLPQTIYLVIRYVEEFTDFIAYKQNLDYKGHRRIAEMVKLEWTEHQPDITTDVEVCRVQLTEDATALELPKDPLSPQSNQIDRRYVPYAGIAGGTMDPELLWNLKMLIARMRKMFSALSRDSGVASANNVVTALVTINMLLDAGTLGPDQAKKLLNLLAELEQDVVNEVEATQPGLSAKKDFSVFKRNVEYLRELTEESPEEGAIGDEKLKELVSQQTKGSAALGNIVRSIVPVRPTVSEEEDAPEPTKGNVVVLDGIPGWEEVKVKSSPFEDTMMVDGVQWTLIDQIDVLNKESEDAHNFGIREARDQYRTRQRLRYPDGQIVADSGIQHEGGFAEFEILNVTPNVDLVIIRRMDYVRAGYECEVYCEGHFVGIVPCPGDDRRFRWRNWPFMVPAKFVTKDRLRVRQAMVTADRDINFFHLWFYQAL